MLLVAIIFLGGSTRGANSGARVTNVRCFCTRICSPRWDAVIGDPASNSEDWTKLQVSERTAGNHWKVQLELEAQQNAAVRRSVGSIDRKLRY